MKRLIVFTLCMAAMLPLMAQEESYSLPQTTFTIQVEARQEAFFAGPYADYAKELLNLDVKKADAVTAQLLSVTLIPQLEADPSARFLVEGEDASLLPICSQGLIAFGSQQEASALKWRFPALPQAHFEGAQMTTPKKEVTRIEHKMVQTDTGFVRMPVEQRVMEDKSLKEMADEAAQTLLSIRRERLNIATGNTDATFSGEALSAALAELSRLEEEYMALFTGYTVEKPFHETFEVIPHPAKNQRYLAFRLSNQEGPVSQGLGTPYYLELEPEELMEIQENSDKKKSKSLTVHYRIPVVCKVTLTEDGKVLIRSRVPVYQLGKEAIISLTK